MARLIPYKGTSAYALGNGENTPDPDNLLLTVFIPKTGPYPDDGYGTIQDALNAQGFFAQFEMDSLPQDVSQLGQVFEAARIWASRQGEVAFAGFKVPRGGRIDHLYSFLRSAGGWEQRSRGTWHTPNIAHMVGLSLTPNSNGNIQPHGRNPAWLQLGLFTLDKGDDFRTQFQPILDLRSGKLMFRFTANKSFFNSMNVSQPFTAARRIEDEMGDKFIVSETLAVSIFATGDRLDDDFVCLLDAELDIFPYRKRFTGPRLATQIMRNGFRIVIEAGGTGKIELTSRDTLGRPLVAILESRGQYLRIIPTPELKHANSDPRIIQVLAAGTTLVPHGKFPIAPVFSDRNLKSRRFKLGPSNTEILEVQEADGQPSVDLNFHINVPQQGALKIPTGGFLVHSLVPWARELETQENIIREIQKGPTLTTGGKDPNGEPIDIVSVWPSFDARGGAIQTYSVQPDAIVRYAPVNPNATPNTLGYQLEKVNLPDGPIPFTFLEGIPDNPFGKPRTRKNKLNRSDLELFLSQHRFRVRDNQWLLAQEGLPPLLARLKDSARENTNITPQGFEVIVGDSNEYRLFVLAKSEDKQGMPIELTLKIRHPKLLNLFQQNAFFLVFPTDQVKGTSVPGIELIAKVRLGDWGFNLEFDKSPLSAEPNNRSVLILKYQKGPLRKLLLDSTLWSNWDLLDPQWHERAKSALIAWVNKVGESADKPKPGYSVIHNILDDEKWTGVLLINPVVDIDALPAALQSIVAGVDLEFFRGHHLGFTQNKIETNEHNIPSITKSSLFGLIDYKDLGSFKESPEFEFRVHKLQILFANSEVQDFSCLLKVRIPQWFKDGVKKAEGGPYISDSKPPDVFGILGRYESFIESNGKKVNKYSFVWDDDITLLNDDWFIFKKVIIDRIELRTVESKPEDGTKIRIRSELLIDANVEFKSIDTDFLSDILSFEELKLTGLTIPFESLLEKIGTTWKNVDIDWQPKLSFEGLSLDIGKVDLRRENSLLRMFPVKFKTFRFFDGPKPLSALKFYPLFSTAGDEFEYGLEWGMDFGGLAKMLGLGSSLNGSLLVAWVPGRRGDKAGISIGLRFDDMGGERLDIGIGSVLRLRAGHFDIFSPGGNAAGTFIVASELQVDIFGNTMPKGDDKFGLLLAPNPVDPLNGPLGWLTTLHMDDLGFIEDFTLSIGQKFKYQGNETDPKIIIDDVKELGSFSIDPKAEPKEKHDLSVAFRTKILETFKYAPDNEWFIGLGGKAAVMEGYALYNPPTLFGGWVGIPGWLTVAILYKQETPQLGIYTGTLNLSDELRSIDLGAVRIQLPQISVKYDTDGGYAIIAGLNLEKPDDFSNAAGAEVGIFKGDGGFMFAQIHGSAFNEIQTIKNNSYPSVDDEDVFSPITRIMLAARVGLGREFNKGILKAGASITIYGILGGTWGKQNLKALAGLPPVDLEAIRTGLPSHYNKFWGEIGVIAEIYGIVDFSVTHPRLDARLLVGIGVTFETWRETLAYIRGELYIYLDWEIARFKLLFKTVVIRIPLSFSTEFREEFVLNEGELEEWATWFNHGHMPLGQLPLPAETISIQEPDWTKSPPNPDQQVAMPLLVTLDLTLADNGKDWRLVPLVFIPFGTTLGRSMIKDTGDSFKALLRLVFDWSLAAFFDSLPENELPFDTWRDIERKVMKRDWTNIESRGSWEAEKAWKILTGHFVFSLGNVNEGESATGTVMMLPSGFGYCVKFEHSDEKYGELGDTKVDPSYLHQLNTFFDELRVKVEEDRGDDAGDALAVDAKGNPRHLTKFLFEEYLESLLLAVWGRIGMLLDRDGSKRTSHSASQIRAFLTTGNESTEAKAISDMINRQVFSGSRVPTEPRVLREQQTETAALFEYAHLVIDVSDWNLSDVKFLTLTHEELGEVSFQSDPSSQPDPEIKPAFGDVQIHPENPYVKGPGDRHPLIGPVEIEGTSETVWTLPEALSAKLYDLRWGQQPSKRLKVILETYSERETDLFANASSREQHSFRPLVLIALPIADVGTGTFQLGQIAEADRRLLDDFLTFLKSSQKMDYDIEFFAEKREDNGRVANLIGVKFDQVKSFIGRVNLSIDPNPTKFSSLLFTRFADDLPLRAAPNKSDPIEYTNFLRLVHLAAETNSGGYLLHLSGWNQPETERVWLGIRLEASENPILYSFANRILTSVKDLPGLVLREDAVAEVLEKGEGPWISVEQAIPLGEPGVLTATVVRSNPNTLYHAPTGPGPRVLTRTQALGWLETMARLETGTLMYLDSRGALPANILDAAGGDAVDLAKRFNLLHMSVSGTGGFKEMPGTYDLPAGPERRKDEKDDAYAPYRYRWSVPAHRMLAGDGHAENDLYHAQEPKPFIYGAIDRLMTVRAGFRDVLGYSPETPDLNVQIDLKDRYFDPLLSVLSLSGLRVGHKIDPETGGLQLHLRFVPKSLVNVIPIPDDKNEERERVRSIRVSYVRAMQQIRDKNTIISVESTLGFETGEFKQALTPAQRLDLFNDLKTCRDELEKLAKVGGTAEWFNLTGIEFQQAGIIPKTKVEPYRIRWCVERNKELAWPEIRNMPRSKVISVAADVPLLDQTQRDLACAIKQWFPGLRFAHTRDGRHEETLYLIDERLVDIKLRKDRPAFGALTPLSTQPYAKSQAPVWNWKDQPGGPDGRPLKDWPKMEISGFDQDEAFLDLLRNMDLVLGPSSAAALWSDPDKVDFVNGLLHAKRKLSEILPKRVISILNLQEDIDLIEKENSTRDALQRNLENSFNKRLERVGEVDTLLAVPFSYETIGTKPGQFLLYGTINTDAETTAQFFPAALRRDDGQSTLIVQFDARQPAQNELYKLPLSFCIEYIRVDIDGDESPFGAMWLKLFEPESVPLTQNNAPVEIPVLFKKLLKKPSISIAEPGTGFAGFKVEDTLEQAIEKARQWTFRFDIERTRAAVQDDLLVDTVYNSRPSLLSFRSASAQRELGEILFEYLSYRETFTMDSERLKALVYWSSQVADALPVHMRPALIDSDPEVVKHYFTLKEDRIGSEQLQITLRKRGEWDHCPFEFGLSNIAATKKHLTPLQSDGPSDCVEGDDVVLSTIRIARPDGDLQSGEYYAGRRIEISKLDILQFENAWPAAVIQRNATLGPYTHVRENFIYQTERIQPGEPLTPFLDVTRPIKLTGTTLEGAITNLFSAIFKNIEKGKEPLIDLAWGYDSGQLDIYRQNGEKKDEGMKVFGRDPIGLFTPRKPSEEYTEEVHIVMESIKQWERKNNGGRRPSSGRYVFELRVYSRLERIEKPLLRLTDLRFDLLTARTEPQ